MAFCPHCGNPVEQGANFCGSCGQKLAAAPQPSNQAPATPSSQQPVRRPNPLSFMNAGEDNSAAQKQTGAPVFTPPGDSSAAQKQGGAPVFTPPGDSSAVQKQGGAPVFTPPTRTFKPPVRHYDGPVCYYHKEEPAVAKCAKCGKFICQDCFDSYGVTNDSEYAGQALCYDCTQQLVAENVEVLKSNKRKIMTTFILTLVGVVIGAIFGASVGEGNGIAIFLAAMIGGCLWTFLKGWFASIAGALSGDFSLVSFVIGAIVGFFLQAILAIYYTIRKIIECIIYLKRTSGFIESDSAALREMTEYMEYTVVRSQNPGVDIETLLEENSQLAGNSVAQMAKTQTPEEIEARMRGCLATINENGEIIRDFAA